MKKVLIALFSLLAVACIAQYLIVSAAANPPALGGTGTSQLPQPGQTLIGNASNTYTPATIAAGPNIKIATSSGGLLIGSNPNLTASSVTATILDNGGMVINVKAPPYNAKCDGVTDDTNAIQNAVNAAQLTMPSASSTGAAILISGPCVARPIFVTGQNISFVGTGWSIPAPGETNGVFPGYGDAVLIAASSTPANSFTLTFNNTSTMIAGNMVHDIAFDGRQAKGTSNVGAVHWGNAVFFQMYNFFIGGYSGDAILIDQAGNIYTPPSTSQAWITNFTIMNSFGDAIDFGNGIFASDFFINNFWINNISGNACINSGTGTAFFNLYLYDGTLDECNDGVYATMYSANIHDLQIGGSWNNGIEINQPAGYGYSSDVHNNLIQDSDENHNGSAGIKVDSGTYDYNFYQNITEGINNTPSFGIYSVDPLGTNRNFVDPSNYSANNTTNFRFGAQTYQGTRFVDFQPTGGSSYFGNVVASGTLLSFGDPVAISGTSIGANPTSSLTDGIVLGQDVQQQNGQPHTWTVDLGSAKMTGQFSAYLSNSSDHAHYSAAVQISTDGTTWSQVASIPSIYMNGNTGWINTYWAATSTRYVRLAENDGSDQYSAHFSEMQVYSPDTFPTSTIYDAGNFTDLATTTVGLYSAPCTGTDASGDLISVACITTSTNNFGGLTNASITPSGPITWSAGSAIGYNTSTAMFLNALYTFLKGITVSGTSTFSSSSYFLAPVTVSSTVNGFYFGIGTAGVGSNFAITTAPYGGTGDNNLAIGQGALANASSGARNVAVGSQALNAVTTAGGNTALGSLALNKETAANNVGIGYEAEQNNVTGDNSTAVGINALGSATSYGNTALGSQAGASLTSGNSNTFVGRDAGNNASQGTGVNNSTAIGQQAYTTASNQVVIGNGSVTQTVMNGNTGINTFNASATLQAVDPTNNSSTILIGASSTKQGCLEMGAASGTMGKIVFVYFDSNAAIFATTTKPAFCM